MRTRTCALMIVIVVGWILLVPSMASADVDCNDFDRQGEAQQVLDESRGDPNDLDRDNDGIACESLPSTNGWAWYIGGVLGAIAGIYLVLQSLNKLDALTVILGGVVIGGIGSLIVEAIVGPRVPSLTEVPVAVISAVIMGAIGGGLVWVIEKRR